MRRRQVRPALRPEVDKVAKATSPEARPQWPVKPRQSRALRKWSTASTACTDLDEVDAEDEDLREDVDLVGLGDDLPAPVPEEEYELPHAPRVMEGAFSRKLRLPSQAELKTAEAWRDKLIKARNDQSWDAIPFSFFLDDEVESESDDESLMPRPGSCALLGEACLLLFGCMAE